MAEHRPPADNGASTGRAAENGDGALGARIASPSSRRSTENGALKANEQDGTTRAPEVVLCATSVANDSSLAVTSNMTRSELLALLDETPRHRWEQTVGAVRLWGVEDVDGQLYCAFVSPPAPLLGTVWHWLGPALVGADLGDKTSLRALVRTTKFVDEFAGRLMVPADCPLFPTLESVARELAHALSLGIRLEDAYAEHHPALPWWTVDQMADLGAGATLFLRLVRSVEPAAATKPRIRGNITDEASELAVVNALLDATGPGVRRAMYKNRDVRLIKILVGEPASLHSNSSPSSNSNSNTRLDFVYYLFDHNTTAGYINVLWSTGSFAYRDVPYARDIVREVVACLATIEWKTAFVSVVLDVFAPVGYFKSHVVRWASCREITTWAHAGFKDVSIDREGTLLTVGLTMTRSDKSI